MGLQVISFGGGVQSSALLKMADEGAFGEKPVAAIFADPGWERHVTYDWIEMMKGAVSIPIVHLRGKNIRKESSPRGPHRFVALPTYLEGGGMGRRQCTKEFKLEPLMRYWREELGATKANPIECWIGISTDEATRIKESRVRYVVNRYPLIERGLSRSDCQKFLKDRFGVVAPKSSCIGCPFHGDDYWAMLRAEAPKEFEDACQLDREIREGSLRPGSSTERQKQYIHRSCIPLGDIKEFRHEKQGRMFLDAFDNECEGMCGL